MLSELCPSPQAWHAQLASALEVLRVEVSVVCSSRGRIPRTRAALARAFVAKAILGYGTTKSFRSALLVDDALRALCGFWRGVPSEATFSRAFAVFARQGLGDSVLNQVARQAFESSVVLEVARDSTAIHARERPLVKPKKVKAPKGRPGRKKGVPPKPKELTRQERQVDEDVVVSLADLAKPCDTGTKRNSKGHDNHWIGYKLHVDVTTDGLPISAITTSASVHDSQVAIPLMKMTASRVLAVCYQLMDAGYVGKSIVQAATGLGQVTIVAPKGNKDKPAIPLDAAKKQRYKARTAVERFNSDLKDNRGGSCIRVRGHAKVHLHLMFGVLAIFALQTLRI